MKVNRTIVVRASQILRPMAIGFTGLTLIYALAGAGLLGVAFVFVSALGTVCVFLMAKGEERYADNPELARRHEIERQVIIDAR